MSSRRQFLQNSALVTVGGVLSPLWGKTWAYPIVSADRLKGEPTPAPVMALVDSDRMRALALQGIDAAKAAGASYADVRITRTVKQSINTEISTQDGGQVVDEEHLAVGIRTLVNGAWGFAASPYWDRDEMTQLATEAVRQAKANARGIQRPVEFEAMPAVTGHWVMPGIDPFRVSIEEKLDFFNSWRLAINERPIAQGVHLALDKSWLRLQRQERTLATTDGTVVSQVGYECYGKIGYVATPARMRDQDRRQSWKSTVRGLHPQGKGWDMFVDARIPEQLPGIQAYTAENFAAPRKPVWYGRYDVVFDAGTMAKLVNDTIGLPTEIDRAVGLEANASGTSYLGPDPLKLLGTYQVGSPLFTVSANRSTPGDLATVQWDDEGVVPDNFPLIRDGILVDYQTTREQAAWLAPHYHKTGQPVRSHGCAGAPSALDVTMQRRANLTMKPGQQDLMFDDLVAGTTKGLACLFSGHFDTDYQGRRGFAQGLFREITNGKLGAIVEDAVFAFEATEIWKNLLAIGGGASAGPIEMSGSRKGQPLQEAFCSVTAVPAVVKQVSLVAEKVR